jgi:formylglycine-generating enzyme required for sulfatase activity
MNIALPSLARLALGVLFASGIATAALAAAPEAPKPVDTSALVAKQVFRDCADCPQMVVIGAGSYTMGKPASEPDNFGISGPQHKVTIRRFALGRHDITRGQYAAFVAATGRRTAKGCDWSPAMQGAPDAAWNHLGFQQDATHPVVCVTLQDANSYVAWLGRQTGRGYRLPTEAEWEYAARAGTTTAYPWGDTASHEQANYGGDKCCGPLKSGRDAWEYTSPVGSFPANGFGLYDMHGNVLQMVQDCLAISYQDHPIDGSAYLSAMKIKASGELADLNGLDSCNHHMLRGGDWGDPPEMIRSAARNFGPVPGDKIEGRSGGIGFRIAATLP